MLQIKQTRGRRMSRSSSKYHPVLRVIRNTFIAVFVLVGLLVGGAFAYTWYNSQSSETPKTTLAIKRSSPPKSLRKPSPTSKVNASLLMLTSPIAPGDNASMSVRTNADANCTIKAEYNKVPAKDSGLVPKKADELGNVTWTWTVSASAPLGKWPVTVLCANLKNSGQVIGDLVVSKTASVSPSPVSAESN